MTVSPKLSKEDTLYVDLAMKFEERCAVCDHFVKPAGCEIVQGKIDPKGWCIFFVKARQDG